MDGVDAHHLHIAYNNTTQAVRDLSLTARTGHIECLVGSNGAGKSSALHALCGLVRPSNGRIRIARDATIGFCPQGDRLLVHYLSAREHLLLFARMRGLSGSLLERRVDLSLRQFALVAGQRPRAMSGGYRRRLAMAIAFQASSVVLLDEPTAGVDVLARRELLGLIAAQSERRAIVMSTHYLDEVRTITRCNLYTVKCIKRYYGVPVTNLARH